MNTILKKLNNCEDQERGEGESAVQEEESHNEVEAQKKEKLQKEAERQKRRNRLKKLATESDAQPKEQMWGTLACDYVGRTLTLTTIDVKQHVEMRAPTTPPDALDVAFHLDVICLSTQTPMQAQRQVLEEMMPQREGQGTGITSGITGAMDACLKGGGATQHSRSTCGVAVDACLKCGGATQYSRSPCDVAVDACLKGGGATQHSRSTSGVAVVGCLKGGGGNPARRFTRNAGRGRS